MTPKKLQNARPPKSCQIPMANLAVWAHLFPRGSEGDLGGPEGPFMSSGLRGRFFGTWNTIILQNASLLPKSTTLRPLNLLQNAMELR